MAEGLHLSTRHRAMIEALLQEHVPGVEVWAYGSRVNGRSHDGSDLDLLLRGPGLEEIPTGQLGDFEEAVKDSTIPFLVEARDWARLPERFHREIERDHVVMVKADQGSGHGTPRMQISPLPSPPISRDLGMASGPWKRMPLGDFVTLQRGHDLPDAVRQPGVRPVLGSFGVTGWHDEARSAGPGVTVGRSGASLGVVSYSPVDYWPLNTTLYVVDFHGNDQRFAYYFLKHFDFRTYNSGSAQPSLNRNFIHPIPVDVPPLPEQRAITHILGTLDDKIELNRRMNETLGALAGALFKSWFVDFDPVGAKMQGHDTGLPKHLADLFPPRLVDSELGEIPEGWEVTPFSECVDVVRGLSYKGSGLSSDGVPMHNLNSIYEGGGYKHDGLKGYDGEHKPQHVARAGDLIVANTEQGHDRLLIGYAAIVPTSFVKDTLFSHHIYRVRPKDCMALTSHYLCQLLNNKAMHEIVSGFANGTTINMLPMDALQTPQIIVPARPVMAAFNYLAEASRKRHEEIIHESRALAALRDTLLPKLISGELRVDEVDPFIKWTV